MGLPLAHIKVVDLTRARSGPSCVRQFADWGADVLMVEDANAEEFGGRENGDFQNLHRNKKSLTLNLKAPEGREILYKLAAEADVVVENFRPDVKFRLGIDYETLARMNPRLVYGSISGFGEEGPYRDRPGLDQIAQGMGAHMSITGFPEQGPVRSGAALADVTSGLYCALGILTALVERGVTGKGRWVRTSLLQAQIGLLDFQAARYLVHGQVPAQQGNDHPTAAAMSLFQAADKPINIAVTGQPKFVTFCKLIDRMDLVADPRFVDGPTRNRNKADLNAQIAVELKKKPAAHWIEALNGAGVPCGPVYKMDEMFADPHVAQLGMVKSVEHPTKGRINLLGQSFTYSDMQADLRFPAPKRGEHTDAVLKQLGYDEAAISRLRERKIV